MARLKHVREKWKVGIKTVGLVSMRMGGEGEGIVAAVSVCKKKTNSNFSASHPAKSSISINDKTPKREPTRKLARKLTAPFRFKWHTER